MDWGHMFVIVIMLILASAILSALNQLHQTIVDCRREVHREVGEYKAWLLLQRQERKPEQPD